MASAIGALFGKSKTPQEQMREYKRTLDRTTRDLERERTKMQTQEQKLIADMRAMARKNQMDAVKIMARDLVRTRKYVTKFYKMRAQMQAVSLRLTTLSSTAQMTDAMKGVTRTMVSMNRQMDVAAMQRVMMEFEKQSDIMTMKEEVMNDAIDDVMDDEGDEETEMEGMVQQIFDELRLDMKDVGRPGTEKLPTEEAPVREDDIKARLDRLGGGGGGAGS
eukprot:TRINITY_DN70608_c0_g1_i1.p1 TRINITY_DN70608_c0_g1~~TRINITY_DN70608_c0_g1_i1.p1  ORF type:complete len:220 (-),score=48.48 TRINITY_DN70608_c0_g1_i1:150-809(-)